VYEQIVGSSPDDEKAVQRLDELRGEKQGGEGKKEKLLSVREKKLRLLGVLERWLAGVEQRKQAAL
ncbi:MAG: hypothetical protein DRG87_11485, partial [Deltaproteobacteria bacterium]